MRSSIQLAVDIVILPDAALTDRAIAVNRDLVARCGSEIVLEAGSCLPHVSLAMGCIDSRQLDAAGDVLNDIVLESPPGRLTVVGVAVMTSATGRKTSSFIVDKSEALQRLHEEVMGRLWPYFSHDVTESMLHGPGPVSASTLAWIRDFRSRASFARFWPHITLGYGEAAPLDRPIPFAAAALALCHLGNHCTCRKTLASAVWRG